MTNLEVVQKAKIDLINTGQTFTTGCDAYRITNLAAQRAGWKVIEKTSGDNCNGRKVDGLIVDGRAIDCLQNAGPPLNGNIPVWQDLGPQAALVALPPVHDPIDDGIDPPIPPSGDLEARVVALEQQMDYVINMLQEFSESDFAVVLPVERIPKNGESK